MSYLLIFCHNLLFSYFFVSDDIDDPNEIGELLNATLTPALTYLAGVNDTILQPFYPEIFDLIDELVLFLQRNFKYVFVYDPQLSMS